ncbi:MAG: HAD-IIIA family hydrolase [Chitinophagaceae bacterium]|nr:HAD-IIIA family hydrolase [Chitinophagaceae bacterium]
MKAVILCGGKGTRLGLTTIPKPMVSIGGKPLLEHQIDLLKRYNITDIIFLSGHLGEVIENYFQDGSKWGVKIEHIQEEIPLGTAGSLKAIQEKLTERFLLLYGDIMLHIDVSAFIGFDAEDGTTIASIVVHPNDHPYDSDLVDVDEKQYVRYFFSKPHQEHFFYNNNVSAALYIVSPQIFSFLEVNTFADFGKDIFPRVIADGTYRIRAYRSAEYMKDIGTPERLEKVEKAYRSGLIERLHKQNQRSCIFIDRDGVINFEKNNLRNIEEFELIPSVWEAISRINKSEFLAIVVTNQPVVAKGWLSVQELGEIHKKMETELGNKRAYVDAIYYCPHHPDGGFEGEVKELKKECDCRKPNIGMIKKAAKEFHINHSTSYIIGDTTTDIMTGKNAGLKTILVRTGMGGKDGKYKVLPDYVANDLYEAVDYILSDNAH